MTWVKLDDKLHSNPKVLEAGHAAVGVYVCALSYCGDHSTDGVVPGFWLVRHSTEELVSRLVELGFWEEIRKGAHRYITRDSGERVDVIAGADGYFIRDFLKINPTRAEVEERRGQRAVAGRRGAQARWGVDGEQNGSSGEVAARYDPVSPPGRPGSRTPDVQGKHGNRHSNSHSTPHRNRIPPDPSLSTKGLSEVRPHQPDAPVCPEPGCGIGPHHGYTWQRVATHLANVHHDQWDDTRIAAWLEERQR